MRRLLLPAALAACLAGTGAAVAPAVSLHPYRAAPVDFELAAPTVPAGTARVAGGQVSRPLRAPARFDLVGMRWRGGAEPAIAVRTRREGRRWSRWTPVSSHGEDAPDAGRPEGRADTGFSTPVWTGGADWVQYRLSRPLPSLRLHFVNSTGTATATTRAVTGLRRLAGRAVVAVAGVASAAPAQPPIVPREQWGAADCQPRQAPEHGEVKAAIVHHTVTTNDYAPEQAPAAVLAICRYHRNSNGWNDIGYNFVVDRFGTVYEGRAGGVDQPVIGAQAQGLNAQTTGIATLGTHGTVPETEAALAAIARLVRWKLPLHGQPTSGKVVVTSAGGRTSRYSRGDQVEIDRVAGHRDGNETECPGTALYGQLDDLRRRVGDVSPDKPRTRIEVAVSPAVVDYGQRAAVSGRLALVSGEPVAGVPVDVQEFGPRGWRTLGAATTGGDGSFSTEVAPQATRLLRALYPGDDARLPSASPGRRVAVRPALQARLSVRRANVGQAPRVTGTVAPARRQVTVRIQRTRGGGAARAQRLTVRVRDGRFAKSVRLREPGVYRVLVSAPADGTTLAATTGPLLVRAVRPSGGASPRRR